MVYQKRNKASRRNSILLLSVIGVLFITLKYVYSNYPKQEITIGKGMAAVVMDKKKEIDYSRILTEGQNQIGKTDTIVIYKITNEIVEETIDARIKNDSIISLTYRMGYNIQDDSLPYLHSTYGKNFKSNYLIPSIRKQIRLAISNLSLDSIKQEDFAPQIDISGYINLKEVKVSVD